MPRYFFNIRIADEVIPDAEGRKLSKSTQATGLRELRSQGLKPSDVRRMVGLN